MDPQTESDIIPLEPSSDNLKIVKKYIIDYASGNTNGDFLIISSVLSSGRKALHEFLEKFTPWISKYSFKLKSLPSGWHVGVRLRCWECDNSKSWLATYKYGVLPNNKDEYYSATCGKCGSIISFDINYDDDDDGDGRKMIVRMYGNNCVVLGSYLNSYIENVPRAKFWKNKFPMTISSDEMSILMSEVEAILPELNDWTGSLTIKRVAKNFNGYPDKLDLQELLSKAIAKS
jgi:hypothetical protein